MADGDVDGLRIQSPIKGEVVAEVPLVAQITTGKFLVAQLRETLQILIIMDVPVAILLIATTMTTPCCILPVVVVARAA